MRNYLWGVVSLLATSLAFAQSSSNIISSKAKDLYHTLRDSNLSLSHYYAFGITRDPVTNDYSGTEQVHMPSISYSDEFWGKLSVTNLWRFNNAIGTETEGVSQEFSRWERLIFNYSHGVLNQEQSGISLSVGVERRQYMDSAYKAAYNQLALNRAYLLASRSFESGFTSINYLYGAHREIIDPSNWATSQYYLYAVTIQAYQLSDRWSLLATEEWFWPLNKYKDQEFQGSKIRETQSVDLTLGLEYQASKRVAVGLEAASNLMTTNDGSTFNKNFWESSTYSVYLSASLF